MDINIRKHIINNFKNDNEETIKSCIDECIKDKDEVTLPGMGVFLEILWENSNENEKNKMVSTIIRHIQKKETLN